MLRSRSLSRSQPVRRPPRIVERVGANPEQGVAGFKGMRSTIQGAIDPSFAEWLQNCYPSDPYNGGAIIARPGRRPYPTPFVGLNLVSTTADFRTHQFFGRGTFNNGIDYLVCIENGKFYSTRTGLWAESLTAATLLTAGITLSPYDNYHATMFNEKLVVVGPTFVFTWNGTAGSGVVKLTNAGASFYGRPTVYAAKLFIIRGNRRTIVWSEEGNETIGYEAGGFANAWDLKQTSQSPIIVIEGTNEALYYARSDSIGSIYGGSADEFQTTSTHDSVNATDGCRCPDGMIEAGDAIWFFDDHNRPACFLKGSRETIPIWRELARAFTPYLDDGIGYASLAQAPNREQTAFLLHFVNNRVVYFRGLEMVFFAYRHFFSTSTAAAFDVLVGYHVRTRRVQTVWTFPTPISGMVEVRDESYGTANYVLILLDVHGRTYSISTHHLLDRNHPTLAFTDSNGFAGTEVDVQASVIGPRHFSTGGEEVRVVRLDIEYIGRKQGAVMDVYHATPEILAHLGVSYNNALLGEGDGNPQTQAIRQSVVLEGPSLGDDATGAPVNSAHATVGYDDLGRWIAFGFNWGHQASRARLVGWKVTGIPAGDQPDSY